MAYEDHEKKKAADRIYRQSPEGKASQARRAKRYYNSEKGKAVIKAREETPDYQAKQKLANEKHEAKPERIAYHKSHNKSPEHKASVEKRRHKPGYKEMMREYAKHYRETFSGRVSVMFHSAKTRAKKLNFQFTITRSFVSERLSQCNGRCEVTGTKFDMSVRDDVQYNPCAPSLDRIDSSEGYTLDNIQIVTDWYNRMKNTLSDDEARSLLLGAQIHLRQNHA